MRARTLSGILLLCGACVHLPATTCPAAWSPGDLPIFVVNQAGADWQHGAREAVKFWDVTEPGAFLDAGDLLDVQPSGSVVVLQEVPMAEDRLGSAVIVRRSCAVLAITVELSPSVPENIRGRVVAHELGHVLGLPDDNTRPQGVMAQGGDRWAYER